MSVKITVLIPCKDEISNIDACIASARRVADEVLVADSGSKDGTLERAEVLADRVIQREYIDSGNFKNWAIPQASHAWVLILDADERVTEALALEIRQRVKAGNDVLAYAISRRNYFLGHPLIHGDWARDDVTRLLQRDHCRYRLSTDHAEIEVPDNRVGKLKSKLVHYTAWDTESYLLKMTHYAHQQAELWYAQGKRPGVVHITLNGPMRFLRGYLLRGGFLDGWVGFHIAALTAYYSFLKQFFFWQLHHGRTQEDVDLSYAAERDRDGSAQRARSPGTRDAA